MKQKELKLTEIHQDILNILPEGRANAISRKRLANLTGYPDRSIRDAIASLRTQGVPIMSTSELGRPGYWIPAPDEMEQDALRFLAETSARIRSLSASTYWAEIVQQEAREA